MDDGLVLFINKDGVESRGNIKDIDDMHIFNLIDYIKDNYDGERPLCNFNYRHCPNDVAYALAALKDTAVFMNLSNRGVNYDRSPKYGVLVVSNNLSVDVKNKINRMKNYFDNNFSEVIIEGNNLECEYFDGEMLDIFTYLDRINVNDIEKRGKVLKL